MSDVLQMGLTLHASVIPMTITGAAMGRSRTAGLPIPFVQTVGMLNAGSSGGPLVHSETGELAGLVVHTVPYLEQVKNARGERLGTVMMRAGLSYSIPVSRLRDWLQKNRIPYPAKQTREVPLAPLRGRSSQSRAFLTTAHLLHLMAAVLHQDRDLLDLAIQHYESALQLEPERPDVLRNLGLALAANGEMDRARVTYERAFAHTPSDPVLLKNMGELRYLMRDTQGAAELYRAAIRQDACLVSASLGLGTVLQAQGQVDEAKQVLRRAAACPSSSSDAAYHVGLALEQQGLGRDALQVWEDVLGQAHSASVNERPILNKIRQRIAQLRAQLTPQDRGVNVAPVASRAPILRSQRRLLNSNSPSRLVPGLGTRRQKLGNFRGLVKIAQIARLRRAYSYLYACFTSNRGGSHGIYSQSRRCPVVWFLAVPRAVQRGAGRACACALRCYEN